NLKMKKNLIALIILISLAAVFTASPRAAEPPEAGAAPQATGSTAQLETINQYCVGCHNDRGKAGGVSFQGLTPAGIGEHSDIFEKAVRKLRGRVMPPPGAKQPDAKAVDSLVAWLEDTLDKAETKAHIPDQVVLHRLNRKEYSNAVRDLLAVE